VKIISRMGRSLLATAVVGASFFAVGAAPASAALHWSDTTHGAKLSGSLQLSSEKHETVSCTMPASQSSFFSFETALHVYTGSNVSGALNVSCPGTTAELMFQMHALSTTSVELMKLTNAAFASPWSGFSYELEKSIADFTNGSGTTPSTLTFSNDKIGKLVQGVDVYATGTLNLTTSTGGLLTLVP